MHEWAGENEAMGHACGIVHHLIFPAITQAEFLEQRVRAHFSLCARHTMITCMKSKYLTRSQTAIKVALLRDDGDTLLDAHRICDHIDAHNVCSATCGQNVCG